MTVANSSLPRSIARALLAVRRRRRVLATLQALCWLLVGPAVLVVAVILWDPDLRVLPPISQSLARLWLVISLTWPLFVWLVPAFRRTHGLSRVARGVDARLPQLHSALETAVDLASSLDATDLSWDPTTRALAHAHLEQSAEDVLAVSAEELLPLSDLGRRTLIGPVAAALALLAVQASSVPVAGVVQALLAAPQVASAATADVGGEPVADLMLRNIAVRLQPPAYSAREELSLRGTTGDFRALPGTLVELSADLSSGGSGVRVQWLGEQDLAAELSGVHLSASFTVAGAGWYRVQLDRSAGREPLRSRRFRVEALPDDPPTLEVAAPPGELEVRAGEAVELELRAADDFALSRLERVILRGSRELQRAPWVEVAGRSEWSGKASWLPGAELSSHGGELDLVVEAWDNDTVNGPKVTRSRPIHLYLPTERDQHRRVLDLKTKLLEQGIDLLAPLLLDGEPPQSNLRADLLEQFDARQTEAMGFFDTAGALAAAAAQDRFEKRSAYLGIGRLVENFARRWRRLEEFVESELRHRKSPLVAVSSVRELGVHRGAVITELEQVLIDLSAYVDLHRGETLAEQLLQAEPLLASLSSLLRDSADGKPVHEELNRALAELAERLRELARKMAERSHGPNDSFQNRLPPELGADLLRSIQDLIEQGRYEEAIEKVRQAMEALNEMVQAMQAEQQMAGGQDAEQLRRQMQEAIAGVRRLEARQEQVIAATEELRQRFGSGEAMSPQQREQLNQDMELLLQRIGDLPPEGLPPRTSGAIRQRGRLARSMAEDMRDAWLRSGDLERAADRGRVAASYLDGMHDELRNPQTATAPQREQANSQISEAADLARDIVRRLQRSSRRAETTRAGAGAAGAGTRAEQLQLRQEVERLRTRMENRSGLAGSAFNPVSGRDSLQAAGQLMQGAAGGLAQGQVGQAMRSEQGALQQLRDFRESLQASSQAMQATGGMGEGMMAQRGGGPGSGDPWQRVDGVQGDATGGESELPDPADFVSPDAFRSLVQEGAAGDTPTRYRPMNSSYYEELIR